MYNSIMINNKKNKEFGKFYEAWKGLRARCSTNRKNYEEISVSNEWDSFENFHRDMYLQYLGHIVKHGKRNTTIDRIDSKKNYCKENCRWATYDIQSRNRSNSNFFEMNGETKTLSEWSRELRIPYDVLRYRLVRKKAHNTLSEAILDIRPKSRKVASYSLEKNEIIKIYSSIREAAKDVRISESGIIRCCKGHSGHSAGLNWEYIN